MGRRIRPTCYMMDDSPTDTSAGGPIGSVSLNSNYVVYGHKYPLDSSFDRDLYADLLYSASPPPPITNIAPLRAATEIRPPHMPYRPTIPTLQQKLQTSLPLQNFVHLLRFLRARNEPMLGPPSSSKVAVRESTVMESNETPMVGSKSRFLHAT
ncbi:transcription factor PIF1 [Forsythia ovata]|uniref:Transcription factor PIF1 n=1 Tax=Forsythia ovata TaxID=205694 RepID=A0ABD1U5X9_9LAMI